MDISQWQLDLFRPEDLPLPLKTQILSFYRCQWPWGFQGDDLFRDWITGVEDQPQHLILHHQETLIASLCLVKRKIDFFGKQVEIAGFTGVLVYPNFQNQGIGSQFIQEASKIALKSHSTICFHCEKEQSPFYQKLGFEAMTTLKVSEGNIQNPKISTGILMIKNQNHELLQKLRDSSGPLYFGPYTW